MLSPFSTSNFLSSPFCSFLRRRSGHSAPVCRPSDFSYHPGLRPGGGEGEMADGGGGWRGRGRGFIKNWQWNRRASVLSNRPMTNRLRNNRRASQHRLCTCDDCHSAYAKFPYICQHQKSENQHATLAQPWTDVFNRCTIPTNHPRQPLPPSIPDYIPSTSAI